MKDKQESGSISAVESLQAATEKCYSTYNSRRRLDRDSLLRNPEVLFQSLARDAAMVRALGSIDPDPHSARVLDVGCGDGDGLWILVRLGFEPANLFGVDIQEDRIRKAKAKIPLVKFECADATSLRFRDGTFDIVMESMMFLQLTDEEIASRIASEMIRVTKLGGTLLVSDWRYSKPGSREFKGVSASRIANLYQVGTRTEVRQTIRGLLIPPVGRFLSKYLPSSYFMVHALCPLLVGHRITVLRKVKNS